MSSDAERALFPASEATGGTIDEEDNNADSATPAHDHHEGQGQDHHHHRSAAETPAATAAGSTQEHVPRPSLAAPTGAAPPPPPVSATASAAAAARVTQTGEEAGSGKGMYAEGRGAGGGGGGGGGAPVLSSGLEVKSEESEIHHYAQAGDVEEVRRCLLAGFNKVDEVDDLGCTPVHLAGAMGHTSVVRLLVEHGAAVDARDGAQCTALHAASEGGHPVVVELLLHLGADIDARNLKQQTPLHYACGYGQVEAVHQLVVRRASVGARDVKGNTPLHLACGEGGADVVRLLLAHGSPLDALNHRGRRPLHLACRNGHREVAIELLEYGADPSARDVDGMQALDMVGAGAGRRIPQGLKLDLINMLERYQLGEYALGRGHMNSTRSLRQMWRDRDSHSNISLSGTPHMAGLGVPAGPSSAAAAAAAAGAAAAAVSASGKVDGKFFASGGGASTTPFSRKGSALDGFSADSYGGGGVAAAGEGGQYDTGGAGVMSGMVIDELGGGGMGGMHGVGGAGHSPRWMVGAQVAGRLEEMRARELAASLRSKVQENEAMKRYLASVKEEMRMLQRKLSGHSSPSSSSPPPSILSSGAGGHRDPGSTAGAGADLPSAATPAASTNMVEQFSIAEMLTRGMYGSNGIGAARQQDVGGGSSDVLDESSSCFQAATRSTGVKAGERTGTAGAAPQSGDVGLEEGSAAERVADATAMARVTAARAGADDTAQAGGVLGAGAVDEDAGGGGKGASQLGTAPSHGSTPREDDPSASSTQDHDRGQAPAFIDAPPSGGGSSAELPSGQVEPGVGGDGGTVPVSISKLLDAKRAQLQSLLDAPRART
eukprot:g5471.t1